MFQVLYCKLKQFKSFTLITSKIDNIKVEVGTTRLYFNQILTRKACRRLEQRRKRQSKLHTVKIYLENKPYYGI